MSAGPESRPAGKSATERSVELASQLMTCVADEELKQASILMRRIHRQKVSGHVLIVLAVIAAGALKEVHGDAWKDHVTDYPDRLNQEAP
jgi:hypothetical protein